jgi:hypothetical protein
VHELVLLALLAAAPSSRVETPATTTVDVPTSDADREAYLLKAQVVKRKPAPGGITGSERATLRQGTVEHDAHIQCHDEYKSAMALSSGTELDFRDSYKNNVAAYRLDRMLGLRMVPVTVVRNIDQKPGSFTWWVDHVKMDEKKRYQEKIASPDADAWNHQIFVVRVFDQLIYNVDRNLGNLLIDEDWRVWMIDHTRAFKVFKDLKDPKNLGDHCERKLLAALRGLEAGRLKAEMKDLLSPPQIEGLLGRRDRIVAYYDAKIAALGEDKVLYDLEAKFNGPVATRP